MRIEFGARLLLPERDLISSMLPKIQLQFYIINV